MDYKYDDGVELLLAHMNIEDIINAAENLYQLEEVEEEGGLSFEEEGSSQEEMDENEEAGDSVGSRSQQTDYEDGVGGVRYGTVTDLLSFVNLLSNMQASALQHLPKEMGVLLNKVRSVTKTRLCLLSLSLFLHEDVIGLEKLVFSTFLNPCLQKDMAVKKGRYQINMDVLLFPWKLTYKNRGPGLVAKGSFGKVHLAQDISTRKRMACKLVSPAEKQLESSQC